jgi:Cu2+-containing amine oxidase
MRHPLLLVVTVSFVLLELVTPALGRGLRSGSPVTRREAPLGDRHLLDPLTEIEHQLWVTSDDPAEMHAAGPYPYQGRAGDGLPQYSNGESIVNRDIVLWYTMGLSHHPDVEEYPVTTTTSVGFRLTPDGFFGRNPALDVPRPSESDARSRAGAP